MPSPPASNFFERSVSSVQSIYAVIIAVAVAKAFDVFLNGGLGHAAGFGAQPLAKWAGIVGFLVTLVPFWHGMNRHLDRCYLQKREAVRQGALLFDFWVFFAESGVLFAAAYSLGSGAWTFYNLGILLGIDTAWGAVSHRVHFAGTKSHALGWSSINACAVALAAVAVHFGGRCEMVWLLTIAVARTAIDYAWGWDFYFPQE